ncbi:dephospho-CoA kinase, partial [Streptomyces halstedii]|uniref:dephospho-CoA kinase n=1 Tax=Streptomyces halstedii TaxID=1944 RepID=UPI00336071F8
PPAAPEPEPHARQMPADAIASGVPGGMTGAQASRAQRLALADDVVVNDGRPEDLQVQVEQLHARYIAAAAE